MQPNEPEIRDYELITDNFMILNALNALFTSSGFNKDELDAIKNAKD